ncbi:DUF1707 SHOCT-like domain-containing protein [Marinitenerispora sediminis]|uniref:DUF1707 domain-containing protein n=1 Tax=Marinitenerispora sediminis TaxID=1931232 RepID=A0A368T7T8_9ACTN|nr:DUF1707 domain-containing protein [Marinitenerispora sediminis]RCV50913.1 hypothetical protein DEF28_16810 [Marinitenerispora sediminis]RCV59727.1 hypothetical protein DEF23_06555 [Marinitenerispora sediminis]RCV59821.1 hypothetical protein DEF24_08675 [Marinitenerispora sediminis]
MATLPGYPSSPLSEEDRDAAVRRLQEAYSTGRIPHEETDARLHRALTAQARGELVPALAPLSQDTADTASTIAAASGRIRRRGTWRVPRFLKVESAFGRVRLDLARALIEHRVVDIELRIGTGGARITVPRDAIVDFGGLRTVWKYPRYRTRRRSRPLGPAIRISGSMEYGRLTVRHARR